MTETLDPSVAVALTYVVPTEFAVTVPDTESTSATEESKLIQERTLFDAFAGAIVTIIGELVPLGKVNLGLARIATIGLRMVIGSDVTLMSVSLY